MTTITVRLIFWGLVGFVPDLDGQRSLTALLVDPARTQVRENCPLPTHFSVVYLLDGNCVEGGDCKRIPEGKGFQADLMGFNLDLGPDKPLQLAWMLDQEELEISGDDETLKLQKPRLGFRARKAPRKDQQISHFSWLQSMNRLTGGKGRVKDDCLGDSNECPLQARFRVDGGAVSACHLLHGNEDSEESIRDVRIFEYTTANGRHTRRAAADAMLVEFQEKGDSITLTSKGLPKRDRKAASARLTPNKQGIITLVVANLPPGPRLGGDGHHRACHRPHSDALFDLLTQEPSSLPIRKLGPTVRLSPGVCEPEAVVLAELLSGASGEIPHSTTSCDGASYP